MFWKAIDQYVYLSFIICSIYIVSYRKSKFISAIILVSLFLPASIPIIGLLFGIPLFIATVITMGLIILDLLEDYKEGKFKTSNFYADLVVLIIGIIILLLAVWPLKDIGLTNFISSSKEVFNFLSIFNYYSLVIAIYLVFNEYNDIKIQRRKSLEKNEQEFLTLKLENIKKELPNELKEEPLLLNNEINNKVEEYIPAEYVNQIRDFNTQKMYTENEMDYLRRHESDNKKNLIFFLSLLVIVFILSIINLSSFKTLNMEKMIKLKYDTNNYITDISYYAPWENYDPNHFYNDINQEAKELSYTEEQIKDIYPDYDNDLQKKIKDANIKVSLSKTQDLKNNDEVEINVSYNEKKAKKKKLRIKNTHFTKTINLLKESITKEEYDKSKFDISQLEKEVENKLNENKITYNNLKIKDQNIEIEQKENYDISYLVINYSLDGKIKKTLKDKEIKNVTYKVEIYEQDNQIKINKDNSNFEY